MVLRIPDNKYLVLKHRNFSKVKKNAADCSIGNQYHNLLLMEPHCGQDWGSLIGKVSYYSSHRNFPVLVILSQCYDRTLLRNTGLAGMGWIHIKAFLGIKISLNLCQTNLSRALTLYGSSNRVSWLTKIIFLFTFIALPGFSRIPMAIMDSLSSAWNEASTARCASLIFWRENNEAACTVEKNCCDASLIMKILLTLCFFLISPWQPFLPVTRK